MTGTTAAKATGITTAAAIAKTLTAGAVADIITIILKSHQSMETARIDKYLWAIRVYKTRSEASDACKGNKVRAGVSIDPAKNQTAKPSKLVRTGEIISIRKGAVTYVYRVKELTENRVGAKLVPDFAENLTPREEMDKLKAPVETLFLRRERGSGRPTKKDRREMDSVLGGIADEEFEDIPDDVAYRFGLTEDEL